MCEIFRMMLSRDAIITEYIGACLNDFPPFLPDAENVVLEGRKIVSFFAHDQVPRFCFEDCSFAVSHSPGKRGTARHGTARLSCVQGSSWVSGFKVQVSIQVCAESAQSGLLAERTESAAQPPCSSDRTGFLPPDAASRTRLDTSARVCAHPKKQKRGIGCFMLRQLVPFVHV